jgi:digeranylgeranylglycerophospholipid reductase
MATAIDVLVVGAGPAGSSAAYIAAANGLETVLIDRKPRIGEQPHCGEFVPRQLVGELDPGKLPIIQQIDSMETRIVSEDWEPIRSISTSSSGFIIDRVRLDRMLAVKAATQGAVVLSGATFSRIDGESWVVKASGEALYFIPKLIIAADGVLSQVAANMNLPRRRFLKGVQYEIPLKLRLNATLVYLNKKIRHGYGWVFPKGDVANVGLGADPQIAAKSLLDQFVEHLRRENVLKPGILARSGGLIPVSGLRENLTVGNVLLCGDAAGLTHPISGAGISQAVISGKLAGTAAVDFLKHGKTAALRLYEDELKNIYKGILDHASSKRKWIEGRWDNGDFAELCGNTWIAFKGYRRRIPGR